MQSVIPQQALLVDIAAMGFHIDGERVPKVPFKAFVRHSRRSSWRIWHARRNVDMLAGLILKFIFRHRLLLVFTSAAQRKHSALTHFFCRHMEEIIAPTAAAAGYLPRPAHVVPHGVDTGRFFPAENLKQEWEKHQLPGKYGMGLFGRIRPDKGTADFVKAAIAALRERPQWTAVIIGQTTPEHQSFEKELRQMIQRAGMEERIRFIGFEKDADAIPRWMRALSITVCASHTEGFGLPCLEAMASGCPVIATQTGAWPEIIDDGINGRLIPTKDSRSLARAMGALMDNPAHRRAMSRNARKTVVNNYQVSHEAEGIQAVYDRLFNRVQTA